jgi:hypothetical protein
MLNTVARVVFFIDMIWWNDEMMHISGGYAEWAVGLGLCPDCWRSEGCCNCATLNCQCCRGMGCFVCDQGYALASI